MGFVKESQKVIKIVELTKEKVTTKIES